MLVAGTTGGIPAVARLLRVVARLPTGAVVLPGLDTAMSERPGPSWTTSHPQAGLAGLLHRLGATRDDVAPWPGAAPDDARTARAATTVPRPAAGWRTGGMARSRHPTTVDGLSLLSPPTSRRKPPRSRMVLRDALETPGATAALVTPDRDLAGRVATELLRYGVVADDSAGEPLADIAAGGVPAPAGARRGGGAGAGGAAGAAEASAGCGRTVARRLPCGGAVAGAGLPARPASAARRGGTASRARTGRRDDTAFLERLEACLEPALRIDTAVVVAPALALAALVEAGERLAATDELPGPSRLWAGEEGEALATRLAEVQAALPLLPDQPHGVLPGLLDAVLEGAVVRSRRALRGRDGTEHPRVFIWGLLEARLQTADVMVLGGLAEGVWPPASDPGAWLSRPMRARVGLPSPEEIVGQSAHDFVSCACAAPTVVLSCPRRRDGAPVVPARWLTRLETLLAGQGKRLPEHPAAGLGSRAGPAGDGAATGTARPDHVRPSPCGRAGCR